MTVSGINGLISILSVPCKRLRIYNRLACIHLQLRAIQTAAVTRVTARIAAAFRPCCRLLLVMFNTRKTYTRPLESRVCYSLLPVIYIVSFDR